MEFASLSNLKRNDVNSAVRVRVVRKWEFRGLSNNGPVQHVDMVLTDDEVWFFFPKLLCV
jgi:hypothetical protein